MTTPAQNLKSKLSLPVIAAPMFLVSTPELVIATCKQGIVGSFPALNQRTSEGFADWLKQVSTALEAARAENPQSKIAPYAVNLIVNKSNPRLEADLELCVQYKVPVIITSLGASQDVVDRVHSYGGIVLHDVTNIYHAKKAAAVGVDGIIAVAAGAGGHAGTINPIVLTAEIRSFFDGILVLAGGLSTGRDIVLAEAMGADFAYMGTRFIATTEAGADAAYKQMIETAQSIDIVYTSVVSGVPANFLRASVENAGYTPEQLKEAAAGKLKSLESEAKAWKNIWSAGQGVSLINDVPDVHTLVQRLKLEYAQARQDLSKKLAP